ncbi:MAG TPA: 23S rRNA (pseudouridine(1915)-N(3))-methyltransferase RlmH [Gemmatimonadales bacterium]|nr:23S rRNA (pseudouridine(1915)-N(3))-methyltransferase RlmH [Gemmatimonadales bacterium]
MRLRIIAVGKLPPPTRALAKQYLDRLRREVDISVVEVREAPSGMGAPEARRREAICLRDQVGAGNLVIALDQAGQLWTSPQIAGQFARWRSSGRDISVLVGGSHGLDATLLEEADARWSLGPITLPHQLARLVLIEQLYRATTILRKLPYHK